MVLTHHGSVFILMKFEEDVKSNII